MTTQAPKLSPEDSATPGLDGAPPNVHQALASLRSGELVVIHDEFRDLGMVSLGAASVTTDAVNFLLTACRGILYVALPEEDLDRLEIPRQVNSPTGGLTVHVPVDLRAGVTTGVSAHDRMMTILGLLDGANKVSSFRVPGHVTPVAMNRGGVLRLPRLPEAMGDLARLAGLPRAVAFAGVLDEQGAMAKRQGLEAFAKQHDLPFLGILDVIRLSRLLEGWQEPASLLTLNMVHLGIRIGVHCKAGQQQSAEFPVSVHGLCAESLLTDDVCGCQRDLKESFDALSRGTHGAVGVQWTIQDVPAHCPRDQSNDRLLAALEQYVAAHVSGAIAVPLHERA